MAALRLNKNFGRQQARTASGSEQIERRIDTKTSASSQKLAYVCPYSIPSFSYQ